MNKNAIKKFAVEARQELISRVKQKALQFGITEENPGNPADDSVNGHLLSGTEKKQRQALMLQIQQKGYEEVMEEVAYTWFNRFIALRFMEVNGYLPTRVRVFTDETGAFKPQILTEAIHMELDGLDMDKVYAYKEANEDDVLYKYLLITQCNALNAVLPGMFQKLSDYTELLFPDNLLREGSVIRKMVEQIPEEDWQDQVQIIGWLYQYYNSDKKDEVFAALKKNVKITKENILAATQLFTPDWIVRYMVENSLGRLWVEGHPNDALKANWKYYLEEAEQEPEVQAQLAEIRKEYAALQPEDLLCIDPCCGSGHILCYLFDVLMQIYESYGVDTRSAVASIVENNLWGLDIDDRAAQLAYFSVMMKACQYDRRFLRRGIQPHVYAIAESNYVDKYAVDYFCKDDAGLKKAMNTIISELHDAKEYGSILTVTEQDWSALYSRFDEIEGDISIYKESALVLKPLVQVAEALARKYDAVVTNPPYMGTKGMNAKMATLLKEKYPESKGDLFAVFIDRCNSFSNKNDMYSMVTQRTWLFISAFEALRIKLLGEATALSFIELGAGAFEDLAGEVVQSVVFAIRHGKINHFRGNYVDLSNTEEKDLLHTKNETNVDISRFADIPGHTFAMKLSNNALDMYAKCDLLSTVATPKKGLISSDNNRFLRLWYEVDVSRIQFSLESMEEQSPTTRWLPHNKGGSYRKWYGNQEYVINWENNGKEVKEYAAKLYGSYSRQIMNEKFYLKPSISWSSISSSKIGIRYYPKGFIFDTAGPSLFILDKKMQKQVFGLLGSKISEYYVKAMNPTINLLASDIANLPLAVTDLNERENISYLVDKNISIAAIDWDSFETSWDFQRHPLIAMIPKGGSFFEVGRILLSECYELWKGECDDRFNQLKANEEELNRIFIDIYGLQGELTPEVEDKDVTVRKADLQRDIKSLISYAVGCMFGRYSIYSDGLLYAGGMGGDGGSLVEKIQDILHARGESRFPEKEFYPDMDNIIPICDDEYFEDDIVGRFVKFIEVVYGKETLDENLQFIADALGGKGQPKEVIRNYFLNDFYNDHCRIYQKRPIYWQFDSGKKSGFKCLIYMHRYQPDTIARIRTDYVHEQQSRYRTAIADLENRITGASASERVKLNKQLKKLQDQASELHTYEEKIHHLADQMISIDLDDGVKHNYEIFKDVLAKIK